MKFALYMHMNGRAEEIMETYISIFGGKELMRTVYTEEMTDNPELIGKIFHAEIKIGDFLLYVTDSKGKVENLYNLVYEVESLENAKDILHKLAEGGELQREMTKMPYGPTIGSVKDKFGIEWDVVAC